jgi:hypothetical protein
VCASSNTFPLRQNSFRTRGIRISRQGRQNVSCLAKLIKLHFEHILRYGSKVAKRSATSCSSLLKPRDLRHKIGFKKIRYEPSSGFTYGYRGSAVWGAFVPEHSVWDDLIMYSTAMLKLEICPVKIIQ